LEVEKVAKSRSAFGVLRKESQGQRSERHAARNGGMVDVSAKNITLRTAKASSSIILGDGVFKTLKEGTCVKGDVLATGKVAAIMAAKSTPAIIPMCHPILIEAVDVEFKMNEANKSVTTIVTVKSSGKTGVEMEALVGASAASLTIYDMLKYQSRDMIITETKLLEKTGGKSGSYKRPD
jgi:cyclic pyranopterin phosphate synthase